MEEQIAAHLSTQLYQKLSEPCPFPSEFSICRVPDQLRKVNENAYEPHVVSIGPYHRGKSHLLKMEEFKMRYLRQLLSRRRGEVEIHEEDVRRCVEAVGQLEQPARQCYDEAISLESEEFVQMLLLDACFIISLICSLFDRSSGETDLKKTLKPHLYRLCRDLLLLENQLPFFVVLKLVNQMGMDTATFTTFCIYYLKAYTKCTGFEIDPNDSNPQSSAHLLDMLHRYWLPFIMRTEIRDMRRSDGLPFIRCATELREAGIKLRKADGRSLFDIRFENGILEIPTFTVEDVTESLLRNLIAYEQLPVTGEIAYVTDYTTLMDCLINTTKDVQLLSQSGIINSYLGDDEVIAALFNRIGDNISLHSEFFCYLELFNKVKKHCSKKLNKWMAKLRHDYFNSPWAMISFLAAVTIVFLTLLQTVFTVASYYHSK